VCQEAAALGVTICVAAGDSGSDDGVGDGQAHVDFPASSPYMLGCGGTSLHASGNTITSETVWNGGDGNGATGGGVSDLFPVPSWQQSAHVPPSVNPSHNTGRGVPDVAGDADPQTGVNVLVDGQAAIVGGTSAVALLYAGLIARINRQLGKSVGLLNPALYRPGSIPSALARGVSTAPHRCPRYHRRHERAQRRARLHRGQGMGRLLRAGGGRWQQIADHPALIHYGVRRVRSRGKSAASFTLGSPASCAIRRSNPNPKPPCGGMP
jgi:hypothetical protein